QTCSLNDALGGHGIGNFKKTGNVCSRDIVTGVPEVFSGGNATVMDIFHVLFQPGLGVGKTPGVSGSVLLPFRRTLRYPSSTGRFTPPKLLPGVTDTGDCIRGRGHTGRLRRS